MFQGAPLTKLIPSKKMNENVIPDQFWDEPEAGRNAVGDGRPEQNLCVFASWRESLFFVPKNGVRCKPVTDRRSGRALQDAIVSARFLRSRWFEAIESNTFSVEK